MAQFPFDDWAGQISLAGMTCTGQTAHRVDNPGSEKIRLAVSMYMTAIMDLPDASP